MKPACLVSQARELLFEGTKKNEDVESANKMRRHRPRKIIEQDVGNRSNLPDSRKNGLDTSLVSNLVPLERRHHHEKRRPATLETQQDASCTSFCK